MGRVELSQHIRAIRGRVGTMVYQVQRGIQTVRRQAEHVTHLNTPEQTNAKRQWIVVTKWWKLLPMEKRVLWVLYAKRQPGGLAAEIHSGSKPLWKKMRGPLEAHSAFFRINYLRRIVGLPLQEEPPTDPSVPVVRIITAEYSEGKINLKIEWVRCKPAGMEPKAYIMLWVKPPDPGYAKMQALIEVDTPEGTVELTLEKVHLWGGDIPIHHMVGFWKLQARALRIDGQISAPSEIHQVVVTPYVPPIPVEIEESEAGEVPESTEQVSFEVTGPGMIATQERGEIPEATEQAQLEVVSPPPAAVEVPETGVIPDSSEESATEVVATPPQEIEETETGEIPESTEEGTLTVE